MRPCHFFQLLVGVHGNGRLVSSLFRQRISFSIKCMLCDRQHFAVAHVKGSVILIDRLGPVILSLWLTQLIDPKLNEIYIFIIYNLPHSYSHSQIEAAVFQNCFRLPK